MRYRVKPFSSFSFLTSVDPKWPLTTTKNKSKLLFNTGNPHICSSIKAGSFLVYSVFNIWTFWLLVTPNGVDLHQKRLGLSTSHVQYTYQVGDPFWLITLLKILCLWLLFKVVGDPSRPYPSKDIVFMTTFQGLHYLTSVDCSYIVLTSVDCNWPLTFTKTVRM